MVKKKTTTDYLAGCNNCDMKWESRHSYNLSKRHAEKTGHDTYCNRLTLTEFTHEEEREKNDKRIESISRT